MASSTHQAMGTLSMLPIACAVLVIQLGGSLGLEFLPRVPVLETGSFGGVETGSFSGSFETGSYGGVETFRPAEIDWSDEEAPSRDGEHREGHWHTSHGDHDHHDHRHEELSPADRWKTQSETLTLNASSNSCEGYTDTAITKNVIEVTFKPEEFPEGCSPEKDLLITTRLFTKGDCPTGKKCENENEKLMIGADICAYSDTMMENFTSNAYWTNEFTNEFTMSSGPMCSQEEKALFALKSLCHEPVTVVVKVDFRLAGDSVCDDGIDGDTVFCAVAITILVVVVATYVYMKRKQITMVLWVLWMCASVCVKKIRKLKAFFKKFGSYRAVPFEFPANEIPASTQASFTAAVHPQNNEVPPL